MSRMRFALTLSLVLYATVVSGQEMQGHHNHSASAASPAKAPESTQAFEKAAADMHRDMAQIYTGDADVDFVKGMIPHHQGAVAMAEIVLKYGKDPEIRALAEKVIAAQNSEIVFMRQWLKKHSAQ